ncbi:hypothetical protein WKH56_20905 [Priestia sp. SB1]|uniref:hypothetical protein n=1 Tax=Priestia sp. SB1 TaxID=3132359 RepID=UPI00317ECC89
MNMESRFYSYNTMLDFQRAVTGLGLTYTANTSLGINQWGYDTTLRAFRIRKDNTTTGYVSFDLGYLEIGDKIELAAELMYVSGSNRGTLAIDRYDGGSVGSGSKTTYSVQAKEGSGFQLEELSFVATKDGYYRATVGLWVSMMGELYIRNPRCTVKSIVKGNDSNFRFGMFRKMTADGQFIRRPEFAGDDCTVTVQNATDLLITWDRPMTGLRPIAFASQEYYIINNKYEPRASYAQLNSVTVRFYQVGSETPVKISDVPNETHFSLWCRN